MKKYGENLKYYRENNNLSQLELAKHTGLSQQAISLWEKDVCEPTLSKLILIAVFFGVSIDYLAGLEL